jgi:hypothetical protein
VLAVVHRDHDPVELADSRHRGGAFRLRRTTGNGVPNYVPESANLIPPYPTKPDEASLNATESERQRANHNPRVGGSSPSSGTVKAPQMLGGPHSAISVSTPQRFLTSSDTSRYGRPWCAGEPRQPTRALEATAATIDALMPARRRAVSAVTGRPRPAARVTGARVHPSSASRRADRAERGYPA